MTRTAIVLAAAVMFAASPAFAKCSDEIKTLQDKAAGKDAVTKPGNQNTTSSPGTVPSEGGGQASASAKVLEAQAHDQRGEEALCIKAVEEARRMTQ